MVWKTGSLCVVIIAVLGSAALGLGIFGSLCWAQDPLTPAVNGFGVVSLFGTSKNPVTSHMDSIGKPDAFAKRMENGPGILPRLIADRWPDTPEPFIGDDPDAVPNLVVPPGYRDGESSCPRIPELVVRPSGSTSLKWRIIQPWYYDLD